MPRKTPDLEIEHTSGNLEVVALLPDYFNPSGKRYQRVQVRCTCGNTSNIHAVRIRRGARHPLP